MSRLRCPRCFQRVVDHGVHVCPTLVPVRPAVVPSEPKRGPGRPRKDPLAVPVLRGPHGGTRAGAGRPRGAGARYTDAQLVEANERRLAGSRWAEVAASMGLDDGEQLRQAIAHRRAQDPGLFPRTVNRGAGTGRPRKVRTAA